MEALLIIGLKVFTMLPTLIGVICAAFSIAGAYLWRG